MDIIVAHLQPNPKTGIFEYRRVFPKRLRPFANPNGGSMYELKRSLGVRSMTEPGAMEKFLQFRAEYERLAVRAEKVAMGRFDTLSLEEIESLVETYSSRELADDDARRYDPAAKARGGAVTAAAEHAGFLLEPHRPSASWAQGVKVVLEEVLGIYRAYAADGDLEGILRAWGDEAASLAAANGLRLDPTSPGFRDFCVALNQAAIRVHEGMLDRFEGKLIPTPPLPAPLVRQTHQPKASSRTFEEIVLELIEKPRAPYTEPTKESVRGGLRYLREAVGVLTPVELTRERVSHFLDLLAQCPARRPREDYRLALPDIVTKYADRPYAKRLNPLTLEKYNNALNARWIEAQKENGAIDPALPSPFAGREFRVRSGGKKQPKGFSPDELRAYFALPFFQEQERPVRGKGEAVYWLPLLAMYTGARPEEVAQLLVADIYQETGGQRWLIRFTDEGMHPSKGKQSLKTERSESGRRTFPVPQALLDLGLLDYRDYLVDREELALFPLLRRKGKRRGIYASFGEWFSPYIRVDRRAKRTPLAG